MRRERRYAIGKKSVDTNARYKILSSLVYFAQITLTIPMFWIDSPYLLKFHDDDMIRFAGLAICYVGLALSVSALVYLGRNYSPCYDSHEPFQLITNGPYKFIRHPSSGLAFKAISRHRRDYGEWVLVVCAHARLGLH